MMALRKSEKKQHVLLGDCQDESADSIFESLGLMPARRES